MPAFRFLWARNELICIGGNYKKNQLKNNLKPEIKDYLLPRLCNFPHVSANYRAHRAWRSMCNFAVGEILTHKFYVKAKQIKELSLLLSVYGHIVMI